MLDNLTVNKQSSIRIAADKVIYFDPLDISGAPHDADIIFITHEHYDHFSAEDIAKASKDGTRFAAPASMAKAFEKAGIDTGKVTFMNVGGSADMDGLPVEAVAAYNPMKPFHPKKNGWLGYVVTVEGKRIYVCGDTDATPEAKAVKCDVICVPIGGTFTMNARQAAELVNAVKPEIAVPIHYGEIVGKKSDGDKFAELVDGGVTVCKKLYV